MCWKGCANFIARPFGATFRPSNVAKLLKHLPREGTTLSASSSAYLQEVWDNRFIHLISRQEGTCIQKGDGLNLRMIDVTLDLLPMHCMWAAVGDVRCELCVL